MKQQYTDDELVAQLQTTKDAIDKVPTKAEYDEFRENRSAFASSSTHALRFGTWTKALAEAGMEGDSRGTATNKQYSNDELLNELERVGDELGHAPSIDTFKEVSGFASVDTYRKRFGGWENALNLAGMDGIEHRTTNKVELIEEISMVAEEKEVIPTSMMYLEHDDTASLNTIYNYFGSWANALKEAGFRDEAVERAQTKRYTEEELLDQLRHVADELQHQPTYAEFDEFDGVAGASTITNRFGRWRKAIRKAGIENHGAGSNKLVTH